MGFNGVFTLGVDSHTVIGWRGVVLMYNT